jgi:ABC-2 type transport system permease protein
MYFFWISVSQIYAGYIGKGDHSFNAVLPVSKKEIVLSKIYSLFILEGLHIIIGIFFGIFHNLIYGQWNFFFDINIAFIGHILLLFAIFNVIFLPMYFKTGYYFGKPVIYGNVAVVIYAFIIEYSITRYQWVRDVLEGDILTQYIILFIGVILSVGLSIFTIRKSISNFESIN